MTPRQMNQAHANLASADGLADHAVRLRSEARRAARYARQAELARLRFLRRVAKRFPGQTFELPRSVKVPAGTGFHWISSFFVGTEDSIQLFPKDGSISPGIFLRADTIQDEHALTEVLDLVTLALNKRFKK